MSSPELYQRSLKKGSDMGEHPRSRGADAPGLCMFLRPTKGVGNAGCRRTRSLACKSVSSTRAYSPRLQPESPGIPARNGFNGLFRALPGDRAFLPPSLADQGSVRARSGAQNLRKLDASVGASGPHDFAVRGFRLRHRYRRLFRRSLGEGEKAPFVSALSTAHGKPALPSPRAPGTAASIASRSASVTIAIRPSVGRDGRGYKLIWVGRKAIFRKFRNKFLSLLNCHRTASSVFPIHSLGLQCDCLILIRGTGMKRREFITFLSGAALSVGAPKAIKAQQTGRLSRRPFHFNTKASSRHTSLTT
jgi:hypothetical protein